MDEFIDRIAPQRGRYWHAQGTILQTLSQFDGAVNEKDIATQRRSFFLLANYHGRTIHILNTAHQRKNDRLAQAALQNLMALHRALVYMYRTDPTVLPVPNVLPASEREALVRDLIVRVLHESSRPLPLDDLTERVHRLDMLGQVSLDDVGGHVDALVHEQFVIVEDSGYKRSHRPYVHLDWNLLSLRALAGDDIYHQLADAGFAELTDVDSRPHDFTLHYTSVAGFTETESGILFVEAARTILATNIEVNRWHFADLIHSPYPRPYQRAAFSALQHGGYRGLVVDAPTGSGKTFIGMMCIQDWLRTLDPGQSILILVPTSNYLQQWTAEMSYSRIGLQLSPDIIFAGTPIKLYQHVMRTGEQPTVVLTTYAALAQFGSPVGKGGFDAASVEMYLQGAKVKYVILDEVHKAVEDMGSVSTQVTRLVMDWMRDGFFYGLVGLSGTALAYRNRFESLGMRMGYSIPVSDLVAAGFVAPFGQLGLPFSYSSRERTIRDRLDMYKDTLRAYFDLLGPGALRREFAALSLETRLTIGHEILGMYHGRKDWQDALQKRFAEWETGPQEALSVPEAHLVTILQIALGLSDSALVARLGADTEAFNALCVRLETVRAELHELIYLPGARRRLEVDGFARRLDADALRALPTTTAAANRGRAAKLLLATTIAGLYDGLTEWYTRMGEGRVETIKATVDAEMRVRDISSTIVFDAGRRIRWRKGVATPGYQGAGGLFAQILGDPRFTVAAVLSTEMYLSYSDTDPLTEIIAAYIENTLIYGAASEAILGLIVQGVTLPEGTLDTLRGTFEQLMHDYVPRLRDIHTARPGEFNRRILKPLRREVKRMKLDEAAEDRLVDRLAPGNVNLQSLEQTFFDYAILARAFRTAHVAELEQISGAVKKFFVVPMPSSSHRKQLMYDLTAHIVDADEIPINFVIVSNWARTGWNVIKPNLLIDATATRDVTAWRQLVGRAIRARRTWTNDCYRLLTILTGHDLIPSAAKAEAVPGESSSLDAGLRALLHEVAPAHLRPLVDSGHIDSLTPEQRHRLVMALAQKRNKVTHIYELIKAYGSDIQLHFDRKDKLWKRQETIAAKHAQEVAPHPFTGELLAGEGHAPFLYADDPRSDSPESLQATLERALPGADDAIIAGWLSGAGTSRQ